MFRKPLTYVFGLIIVLVVYALLFESNSDYSSGIPDLESFEQEGMYASIQQRDYIREGLYPGYDIGLGWSIRSDKASPEAYYVAAYVTGTGYNNYVGVWILSGTYTSPGVVNSVNDVAKRVTVYPDASDTGFNAMSDDREAEAAKANLYYAAYKE